jgi:hypothetical protein
VAYSPDFRRLAFQVVIERDTGNIKHAGWLDSNGKITDVNADAPTTMGPFGGGPSGLPNFEPIGFDGAGNFFYNETHSNTAYELAPGQTAGAKKLGEYQGTYIRMANGDLYGKSYSCLAGGLGGWLSADEYVYALPPSSQIISENIKDNPDLEGGCQNGTPLLPATNTSSVGPAVVSPDGTRVAFLGPGDDANSVGLWTVDTTGHGQPIRVPLEDSRVVFGPVGRLLGWK